MAELKVELRWVELEQVAEYLKCDPARLRIALEHLMSTPTVIEYSPGHIVTIAPANDRILIVVKILADAAHKMFEAMPAEQRRLIEAESATPDTRPVDPAVEKWLN